MRVIALNLTPQGRKKLIGLLLCLKPALSSSLLFLTISFSFQDIITVYKISGNFVAFVVVVIRQ